MSVRRGVVVVVAGPEKINVLDTRMISSNVRDTYKSLQQTLVNPSNAQLQFQVWINYKRLDIVFPTWKLDALNRRFSPRSSRTVTSKLQYLPKFLTKKTRYGSLMPRVLVARDGVVMNVVGKWVDRISRTCELSVSSTTKSTRGSC